MNIFYNGQTHNAYLKKSKIITNNKILNEVLKNSDIQKIILIMYYLGNVKSLNLELLIKKLNMEL